MQSLSAVCVCILFSCSESTFLSFYLAHMYIYTYKLKKMKVDLNQERHICKRQNYIKNKDEITEYSG